MSNVIFSDSKRKESRTGSGGKERERSKERDKTEKEREKSRDRDKENDKDKDRHKQVFFHVDFQLSSTHALCTSERNPTAKKIWLSNSYERFW